MLNLEQPLGVQSSDLDPAYAQFRDQTRFWIQRVAVPLLMVIGLFGNLITMIIMTRRGMRSTTNMYLAALAFVDMLYLVLTFLLGLSHYPNMAGPRYYAYWRLRPFLMMLTDACSNTSVWLTVTFTIERYIAVKYPMKGKVWCTEKRAKMMIICVFVIGTLFAAPVPFEWKVIERKSPINEDIKRGGDKTTNIEHNNVTFKSMNITRSNNLDITNFNSDENNSDKHQLTSSNNNLVKKEESSSSSTNTNKDNEGDNNDDEEEDAALESYTLALDYSDFGRNENYKTIYYCATAVIFYFVPLFSLMLFNGFLIKSVHQSQRERTKMTGRTTSFTTSSSTATLRLARSRYNSTTNPKVNVNLFSNTGRSNQLMDGQDKKGSTAMTESGIPLPSKKLSIDRHRRFKLLLSSPTTRRKSSKTSSSIQDSVPTLMIQKCFRKYPLIKQHSGRVTKSECTLDSLPKQTTMNQRQNVPLLAEALSNNNSNYYNNENCDTNNNNKNLNTTTVDSKEEESNESLVQRNCDTESIVRPIDVELNECNSKNKLTEFNEISIQQQKSNTTSSDCNASLRGEATETSEDFPNKYSVSLKVSQVDSKGRGRGRVGGDGDGDGGCAGDRRGGERGGLGVNFNPSTNSSFSSQQTIAPASSQERRITIMLIAVVILFLFCQIPSAAMLLYTSVREMVPNTNEHALVLAFGNIFNFLVAVNAAGNFILYSFLSKKYRSTFVTIFCGCLGSISKQNQTNQNNNNIIKNNINHQTNRLVSVRFENQAQAQKNSTSIFQGNKLCDKMRRDTLV